MIAVIKATSVCIFGVFCLFGCTVPAGSAAEVFGQPQRIATGKRPTAVHIADVTGDGLSDLLIVTQRGAELMVFSGDGHGGLSHTGSFEAGPSPSSLAVGDFDDDGDLDVAVTNHETLFLTVLINEDGAGTFVAGPGSPLRLPVRPHPHEVRSLDMDQDGHLDLLIDDRHGGGFALLAGKGDGSFSDPPIHIDANGDPYLGMAIGDLNDDGRADIVAPLSNSVTVILSEHESYGDPLAIASHGAFAVELADLDGDQKLDLIMATEPGEVGVLKGLGGGRFEENMQWRTAAGAKRIAVGDFNADDSLDIVVQNYMASQLFVLPGTDDKLKSFTLDAGTNPWGLAIGDLNRDGRDDLVSLDYNNDVALIFLSLPVP